MRITGFHRAILLIATAIVIIAALWWKCRFDPVINFLPGDSRAEWIVFPSPIQAGTHKIAMLDATFRREFQIGNLPKLARLEIRAARRVELKINSTPIEIGTPRNWKSVATLDVAGFLQSGPNKIEARVFNDDAPPALWLRLSVDDLQVRSDENWEASFAGSAWRKAILAAEPRRPQPGNLLAGGENIFAVLPKIWPAWVAFVLVAGLGVWCGDRLITSISKKPSIRISIFAGLAALAWIVLFWNNTRLLPFHCGYDSTDHTAYIKYIQERRALPLPTEGFEAFQPPLYYAVSAAALSVAGLTMANPGSIALLRALTMCFGIAHFVIVLLCLRLLFPKRPGAQAAGLLLAAFLPMQLYLSHYPTNETLAAALVSLAIYFALHILKKDASSVWEFCGLGLCVGAAMLTKATALLLIPPLFGALILKMTHDKVSLRTASSMLGATLAVLFAVCGWYYIWIWKHFGTPIVGNWERRFGFNWWQDPGFHTAIQYFRFGGALIDPLFSGYNSFADGIFSTLWGDGLGGGLSDMLSRTPWNYDLMTGGYWLALVPTFLVVTGAAIAIRRLIRQSSAEWFLLICFSAVVAVALIFMTLRVASYAQVKAFYGLSTLVPLCAFAAVGWEKIRSTRRLLRLILASLLAAWALNGFFTFWIRDSATQHIYAASRLITEQRMDAAANQAMQAIAKDPSNSIAQCFCGAILDEANRHSEATDLLLRGIQLDPINGQCQLQMAIDLAEKGDFNQAMSIASRIAQVEPENSRAYDFWFTCAHQAQQIDKAMTIGRDALALSPFNADLHYRFGLVAGQIGDFSTAVPQLAYALLLRPDSSEIAQKLRKAIEFAVKAPNAREQLANIAFAPPDSPPLLEKLAWTFATHPDSAMRSGQRAVELANRACQLTDGKQAELVVTLAVAYAEDGKFDKAIETAENALALARADRNATTIDFIEKLIASLQNQQPYREGLTP
jgi:tetratricopeptide (TPR) repeat protein